MIYFFSKSLSISVFMHEIDLMPRREISLSAFTTFSERHICILLPCFMKLFLLLSLKNILWKIQFPCRYVGLCCFLKAGTKSAFQMTYAIWNQIGGCSAWEIFIELSFAIFPQSGTGTHWLFLIWCTSSNEEPGTTLSIDLNNLMNCFVLNGSVSQREIWSKYGSRMQMWKRKEGEDGQGVRGSFQRKNNCRLSPLLTVCFCLYIYLFLMQ